MRGRLIQRFIVAIRRMDAVATAAVVGGGYDDDFQAPIPVRDGTQSGASSRREMDAVRLPCQVQRRSWGNDRPTATGHEIDYDLTFILHATDLEAAGLIDANGNVQFAQGDRIEALETTAGATEETFDNPPGLFVMETERAGYGLNCFGVARFNLLFLRCRYAAFTRESAT